jgi:hypothetical protein
MNISTVTGAYTIEETQFRIYWNSVIFMNEEIYYYKNCYYFGKFGKLLQSHLAKEALNILVDDYNQALMHIECY